MTNIHIVPPKMSYTVVVREDEATDGSRIYLAEIPELPGCMSHGETPEEALQNVSEAAELYVEALAASGQPVPAPRHAPLTSGTDFDGVAVVRPSEDAEASIMLRVEKVAF